ncbi:hypothetical protein F2Q68_00008042 [Brassica cretica]|uniref:Uncharacterized protein n=1 Tax=Brassica cretica TaxID=69181 RepID=A0A8S9KYW7_BRACR|nr:hypothetical protein F2Q68_00008042 [Brassica cretica]
MYTSFSPLLRKKFSSFAKNELRGNGTLSLTQPRSGGAGVSFDPGSKLMNIGEFDYFFTVLNSLSVDRWIKTRQMKWMRSFVSREEKGMLPQEERERLHFPLADMSLILNYPSCEMSLHQES